MRDPAELEWRMRRPDVFRIAPQGAWIREFVRPTIETDRATIRNAMAEDDRDRERERGAEREAEIRSEMERVDQDPDQVSEGSEDLGTQSSPSGHSREEQHADEGTIDEEE